MSFLMWMTGFAALAFVLWCAAAFALRLPHLGRLIVTISVPGAIAAGYFWLLYLDKRSPGGEAGWDAIFMIVSFAGGSFVALAMLPIWFIAEERLGWRAR